MSETTIHINLTVGRRLLRGLGAAIFMLCAVPELDSESVTLSTYYPAPSGVYTNMITTGNTYLARDGAGATRVGIGTTAPSEKLHVVGKGVFSDKIYGGGYYGNGVGGVNSYSMEVGGPAPNATNGNATIFLHHHGVIAHQLRYTNGTLSLEAAGSGGYGTSVTPTLSVGGAIQTFQGGSCSGPQTYSYSTPGGGSQTLCPGQYVTNVAGVFTKYIILPIDRGPNLSPPVNPTANYICCPCPAGGCGGM